MAKKYFQAKKLTKNPFVIGKNRPRSQKNQVMVWTLLGVFLVVAVSAGGSYLYKAATGSHSKPKEKKLANSQEGHKKRVVKPLSDEDFKGAKEYNFYTQLEGRSLAMGGVDHFGGVSQDSIIKAPPKLELESMAQNHAPKPVTPPKAPPVAQSKIPPAKPVVPSKPVETPKPPKKQEVAMSPLVLESAQQNKPKPAVKEQSQANQARKVSLQIGSFISPKEADIQKAKLARYGFSPRVIQGKNNAGQTVYRVHLGPFASSEIRSIKERLGSLGVSYFEVK